MIPKIIHCCWLGGGPKNALSLKCRASWKKYAPDCEIREWDMEAVEATGASVPPFVREAIARRKWAFAADWIRFLALSLEGGLYFDCDFELIAPIDDLIKQGPFVNAHWGVDGSVGIEAAIMALEKNSPIARAMLNYYATAEFDGRTTVGEVLAGIVGGKCPIRVLPPQVFSPIDIEGKLRRSKDTRGIHHYAMSWAPPSRRIAKWLSWHGMRGVVEFFLKWKAKASI